MTRVRRRDPQRAGGRHPHGSVVSADVAGSFRELVLFIQDDNILTRLGNSSGSSYNLRVEPPARGRAPPELFNGAVYGDPETPVLEAQVGDRSSCARWWRGPTTSTRGIWTATGFGSSL